MTRGSNARTAADYFGVASKPSAEPQDHRGAGGSSGGGGGGGGGGGFKRLFAVFGKAAPAPAAAATTRPPSDGPSASRAGSSFMLMWRSTREPADILVNDQTGRMGSTRYGSVSRFGSVTGLMVDRRWENSATDVVAAARMGDPQQHQQHQRQREFPEGRRRGYQVESRSSDSDPERRQYDPTQRNQQQEEEQGQEEGLGCDEETRRQRAIESWHRSLQLQQLTALHTANAEDEPQQRPGRLEYMPYDAAAAQRAARAAQPPQLPRPPQPPRPPAQTQVHGPGQGQLGQAAPAKLEYSPTERRSNQRPTAQRLLLQQPPTHPMQQSSPSRSSVEALRLGPPDTSAGTGTVRAFPQSEPGRGFAPPATETPVPLFSRSSQGSLFAAQQAERPQPHPAERPPPAPTPVKVANTSAAHTRLREVEMDMATVDEAGEDDATLEELEAEVLGGLAPRSRTAGPTDGARAVAPRSHTGAGDDEPASSSGARMAQVRWTVPAPPQAPPTGAVTYPSQPPAPPRRERTLRHSAVSCVSAFSAASAVSNASAASAASVAISVASSSTSAMTTNAASASCRSSASGVPADLSPSAISRRALFPRDGGHTAAAAGDMRVALLQKHRTSGSGSGTGMQKWPSNNSNGSDGSSAKGLHKLTGEEDDARGPASPSLVPSLGSEGSGLCVPGARVSNPGGLALRVRHDMENRAAREAAAGTMAGAATAVAVRDAAGSGAVSSGPASASTPRWKDMMAVASAALDDGGGAKDDVHGDRSSLPGLGGGGGGGASAAASGWQSRSSRTLRPAAEPSADPLPTPPPLMATKSALMLRRADTDPPNGLYGSGGRGPQDPVQPGGADRYPASLAFTPPRWGGGSAGSGPSPAPPVPTPAPPPPLPVLRRITTDMGGDGPTPPRRESGAGHRVSFTAETLAASNAPSPTRASYTGSRPPAQTRASYTGGGGEAGGGDRSLEDMVMSSLFDAAGPGAGGDAPGPLTPAPPTRVSPTGGAAPRPLGSRRRLGGEQLSLGAEPSGGGLWPAAPPSEPPRPPVLRYASAKEVAMVRS
ncbi:hypothetical protein GPECTOR_343g88 [Gonium pectorale]|uniref:Uncharacterized protein n=1 Tax=Gonium pectorale TaxID=33097 RepID=A0A150FVP8_GONPE|nr:hypothetical protein GPECTOR_343g88 [Gonium pectorale]|eukprot:KXZ41648.1 hypothetical protein GPECTOR_343g88 [Gonium pectorale]